MTNQSEAPAPRRFPAVVLPWIIAGGALGVYLATLNRWVSLESLPQVAKLSGWTWQPELHGPAFWLVSYPLRWLPPGAIPLALNLFSAVCGALCLALLARSVALLPHDRTQEERDRLSDGRAVGRSGAGGAESCLAIPAAWIPPVLAAFVCGLQLTFWEHATAGSAQFYTSGSDEMFDLLLFAYVVRCLLEFRVDRRESWLIRATLVYGVGMTNNWAMLGFVPLFVMALVWLKGLKFFNRRFLTGIGLSGAAGLSFYLLLPLVQTMSGYGLVSFWPALKSAIGGQWKLLHTLFQMRGQLWVLGLFSLVPVLVISIRWAPYFGDSSRLGVGLARFMFFLVHGMFLLVCVWVALDPRVSPRNKGFGIPFLTFYYLGALCVGYFSGYYLLVFGARTQGSRRPPRNLRLANGLVRGAVWALLVLAPTALVYRNLPQIRITNGPMLGEYASFMAQNLPAGGAVIMSDDSRHLLLLESWVAQHGKLKDYVFVDSVGKTANGTPGPLTYPEYHRFLKRQHPDRWPVLVPKGFNQPVDDGFLVQLALRLAASNSVYYLQPSFGYYFEFFYQEPHGLVYRLKPYSAETLLPPPLSKELIDENKRFWEVADRSALEPLAAVVASSEPAERPSLLERAEAKARLVKPQNREAAVLAGLYSRAVDYWGVELQKLGQFTNAAACFSRALELKPDNVVAKINLQYNADLQAARASRVRVPDSPEDEFGKARTWDAVIGEDGPFDEPNFSFQQGMTLARNNLQHQAAQHLDRVRSLMPRNVLARVWLAQLYIVNHLPSKGLELVKEIRADPEKFPVANTNRTEMLYVETSAHLATGDLEGAEQAVQAALKRYPNDMDLLEAATQVYLYYRCFTNALATVEQQIRLSPTNMTALVNKGNVCIWLGNYHEAIPALTNALLVDSNNPYAILDLAIANLECNNLDEAQRRYEALQKVMPKSPRVNFGLQEIAYRKKDTNAAIRYCQLYLDKAPTNTAEANMITARLKELRR